MKGTPGPGSSHRCTLPYCWNTHYPHLYRSAFSCSFCSRYPLFDALSNWDQEKCLAGYGDVYYFNPSTSEAEARGFLSAKPSWSTWKDPLKKWGGEGRDERETLKKPWKTVWRVHGHTWLSALGWVDPNWCSGDSSLGMTQASSAHGHSVLVLSMRCCGA